MTLAASRGDALRVVQPHVGMGDPHVCSDDRQRLSLLHAVYQPLVRRGVAGAYLPAFARAWRVDASATRWVFDIDRDARWHDGAVVRAGDAAASLVRLRDDPPAGELGTSGVYQGYLRGCVISVKDDATLEVVTPAPMADLLDVLAELFVLPERHLADAAALPPGSGPYRLLARDDEEVLLERADRGVDDARPRRLRFRALADAAARAAAVAAGEAAIASDIDPRACGIATHFQPSSVATAFMFALDRGATADVRVRRALNLAVDVPSLIEALFAGRAEPLASPCTATQLGFDPELVPYPFDPEGARSLLREAGVEGLRLTFDVPSRLPDEAPRLGAMLAEQFAGVGVALEVVEHGDRPAYAEMVRDGRIHDAACFDSSPHSTFRSLREKFHAGARGPWWLGYANERFDALVDEAQRTPDLAARRALYHRAARLLHDDAPWLYLYGAQLGWGLAADWSRWRPTPDGLVGFEPWQRSVT